MKQQKPFYTTQLQAGLGLVDETRILLDLFEADMTTGELYTKALDSGLFPSISARRLRNVITECFAPRYLRPPATTQHLKKLNNKGMTSILKQLFFLYTVRANQILADFIRENFWECYQSGRDSINIQDARDFVNNAIQEGKTQKPWSDTTIRRISSYLIGCCADFGLLSSARQSTRKILPFRIHEQTAAYLAYDLHFIGLGDNSVVAHPDWQLFGLDKNDVRDELKRLSLKGLLIFQSAGDVSRISWQYKTMEDVIDVIAKS